MKKTIRVEKRLLRGIMKIKCRIYLHFLIIKIKLIILKTHNINNINNANNINNINNVNSRINLMSYSKR